MPNSDIQGLNSGKHHSKTTGSLSETVETMGENQGPQTRNERQRKTAKEQTTAKPRFQIESWPQPALPLQAS